tara:strand:+ start:4358 stop:4516 length:159 start_codon:yes stop_codon:yes gene_type:complete
MLWGATIGGIKIRSTDELERLIERYAYSTVPSTVGRMLASWNAAARPGSVTE